MISQKNLFSLRFDAHYLNCAYKSPLLKSAEEAALKSLIRGRNPMDIVAMDFFTEANEVSALFGQLVNCNPEQVACLPSTSYGFASALKNIPPKPQGNCLVVKDEFPSGYFSLKSWCDANGNQLRTIAPSQGDEAIGASWNKNILDAINNGTTVVLISSVHWMSGIKFDLKEIGLKCRAVGAKFIIDGSQSVGITPIDVKELNIDVLVCAGYKWLFGPYSMCLAFFNESFNNGVPLEESWMNRKDASDFSQLMNYSEEYETGAGRYDVGEKSNLIVMPIMKEGLKQIMLWGVENMQQYCRDLMAPLIDYAIKNNLRIEESAFRSDHLLGLKLEDSTKAFELKKALSEKKISVSVRGDQVRVSVNVFNDAEDINQLIKVLSKV